MIDSKRKGKLMQCHKCGRKTEHIFTGAIEKNNINRDDYGRIYTGKVNWFQCTMCGDFRIIDRWG